jgi:hypothetical protein
VARYVLKDPEDHDEHGSSEAAAMVSWKSQPYVAHSC